MVRRITWRSADIARVLVLGLIFLFLWKFFWMVYSALFLALLAILIAIILYTPAKFLSRWIPFRVGFALTMLAFVAALVVFFVQLIPQIYEQIPLLARQIPVALQAAAAWFERESGSSGAVQIA